MFMGKPVRIPNMPGKIVFRKKGENSYVMLETGRSYDPERQYTNVERKMIGVQIPERPEYMLPNENYRELFPEKDPAEDPALENYTRERDRTERATAYFDQVYFEFMMLSRRMPEGKLSANKARRINQVLRPMKELLEAAGMTEMLELLPERPSGTGKEENAEGKGPVPMGQARKHARTVHTREGSQPHFQRKM